MEVSFVSDINDVILNHYNEKEYQEIYHVIDASITDMSSTMDYDAAYRLQQDIATLNTSMMSEISKYINTTSLTTSSNDGENTRKDDTFEGQSNLSKINLFYKYFYLIFKIVVIIALLILLYFRLFVSSNVKQNTSSSFAMRGL
jgi:hypothetical protein